MTDSLFEHPGRKFTVVETSFFSRWFNRDKAIRKERQALEMIWKSNQRFGQSEHIFTGILPNIYHPPEGFCYDRKCWDEFNENDKQDIVLAFVALLREQAKSYATNHTIVTMGDDFHFYDAEKWYVNLDWLIDAVNSMSDQHGVHLVYSTPACYMEGLHSAKRHWPGNVCQLCI